MGDGRAWRLGIALVEHSTHGERDPERRERDPASAVLESFRRQARPCRHAGMQGKHSCRVLLTHRCLPFLSHRWQAAALRRGRRRCRGHMDGG